MGMGSGYGALKKSLLWQLKVKMTEIQKFPEILLKELYHSPGLLLLNNWMYCYL